MNRITILISLLLSSIGINARDVEVECLYTINDIDLSEVPMASIAGQGLYAAVGNKIVSMEYSDNTLLQGIALPDSVTIDQFFYDGDNFVFRSDNNLIWSNVSGRFDGIQFEDSEFTIAPATTNSVFILRAAAKQVIEISLDEKRPLQLFSVEGCPIAAGKFGSGEVIVTDRDIYLHLGENEMNLLHRHPLTIKSADITPLGIYFGTEHDLWHLIGIDTLEHVASADIKRIFGTGAFLYVLDSMSNLYKFTLSQN